MVYRNAPLAPQEKVRPHVLFLGNTRGSTFSVPPLGRHCVCCNVDTFGRTESFDPSTDKIHADKVEVPVCAGCHQHALSSNLRILLGVCGFAVGISLTYLGFAYHAERPDDSFLIGVIAFGATLVTLVTVLGTRGWLRVRDLESRGHHPGFHLSVGSGRTILRTTNPDLAQNLVGSGVATRIR